jgi:hypothetical protein
VTTQLAAVPHLLSALVDGLVIDENLLLAREQALVELYGVLFVLDAEGPEQTTFRPEMHSQKATYDFNCFPQ